MPKISIPLPPPPFTPNNWYWTVAGSTSQVYSSASGGYVPVSDPTYQTWLGSGGIATRIDTEANLGSVLANYLLRPTPSGVLDGYTSALANNVITQAVFKILFNHENRLRACERALGLNGSPPDLTAGQAFNAVKNLM